MSVNEQDNPASPNMPAGAADFKPWEQRAAPGMGGGAGELQSGAEADSPGQYDHAVQAAEPPRLQQLVNEQTDMVHLTRLDQSTTPQTDLTLKAESNADAWKQFNTEQLYDTRRVTLEHFHLFEWFPLAPGKFHTTDARFHRQQAASMMFRSADGSFYYTPYGKGEMLEGGIGAVRMRPVRLDGEDYYFMTASSSGVCHEGFPVVVPRRFYGPLKQRMLAEGAAPARVSGEMRYVPKEAVPFFGTARDLPLLYLFADEVQLLSAPRPDVTHFAISVAVSFQGRVDGTPGDYVTYCTFDPSTAQGLQEAVNWIQDFYVKAQYKGTVITDFDDVRPHFPNAVFSLANLRAGTLDEQQVRTFLQAHGWDEKTGHPFLVQYNDYRQVAQVVQGDQINVGDITNSSAIAIGRGAAANVNPAH